METSRFKLFVIRKICIKFESSEEPSFSNIRMTIVLLIPGSVMFIILWKRFAPSTLAASYSSGLMPASAARKIIVPQPASFQMDCRIMSGRNHSLLTRNNVFELNHCSM
ncbi:hypothetical protein D3C86_1966860 [compost metagenome]